MTLSKTIVAVVVDQEFGHRLWELARHVPVWVCNSEANSPVIEEIWEKSRLSPSKLLSPLSHVQALLLKQLSSRTWKPSICIIRPGLCWKSTA